MSTDKRTSRLGSWAGVAALLLAPLLASGSELTSVEVLDPSGPATLAKVSVVNAATGIPMAAGVTDPISGRFSFASREGMQLIVAVLTTSGYAGAGRIASGEDWQVTADQDVDVLADDAAQRLPPAPVSLEASELFDFQPSVAGAHFAAARWTSFASVAFGPIAPDGHIGFMVPPAMEDAFLLCIVWQDEGEVRLKLVRSAEISTNDGGGEDGAFPTF